MCCDGSVVKILGAMKAVLLLPSAPYEELALDDIDYPAL